METNPRQSSESQTEFALQLGVGVEHDLASQVVLILVGLVGCGKSTFAQALQDCLPHFRRCSQDELGNRRRVEDLARLSLQEGLSVCIDRTNIDLKQRATWISIAREIADVQVWVLIFDTPYQVCEQRLLARQNHPTIASPEAGVAILQRFSSQYQRPQPSEGHDRELKLYYSEQKEHYSASDLRAILKRLDSSPPMSLSSLGSGSNQPRDRARGARASWRGRNTQHKGDYSPVRRPTGNHGENYAGPWRTFNKS